MSIEQMDKDSELVSVGSGGTSILCVCVSSTAMMLSAREGHVEVVKVLCESHADPDLQDQAGLTAIDHALRQNHQL